MARVNSIYLALLAGLLILVVSNPGWAHDAAYPGNLSILNVYDTVEYVHADADDGYGFKGSFTLTVTNNSSVAWGDFHFQIFQVDTNDYSQVYFTHDMVGFSGDMILPHPAYGILRLSQCLLLKEGQGMKGMHQRQPVVGLEPLSGETGKPVVAVNHIIRFFLELNMILQ